MQSCIADPEPLTAGLLLLYCRSTSFSGGLFLAVNGSSTDPIFPGGPTARIAQKTSPLHQGPVWSLRLSRRAPSPDARPRVYILAVGQHWGHLIDHPSSEQTRPKRSTYMVLGYSFRPTDMCTVYTYILQLMTGSAHQRATRR